MDNSKYNNKTKHYSEEEIALFALGEVTDKQKQKEFFDHLENCFSCNELYKEISEFYEAADKPELLLEAGTEKEISKQNLKPQYKSSFFSSLATANYYIPAKWISFVFRRPVLSGGGFLFVIALFVLALNFKAIVKDKNPVSYSINDSKGDLEFYNKDKEFLWKIHFSDNFNQKTSFLEGSNHTKNTVIIDTDNDGYNEIITSRYLVTKYNEKNYIYIYNYDGKVRERRAHEEPVVWRGYKYPPIYFFDQILLNRRDSTNDFDFYVLYNHYHAPGRILRLDKKLNIMGEFWHRGHFRNLYLYYNQKLSIKNLFLAGCDDLLHNASLIVLDPNKLVGKKEASSTYGYDFGTTNAELISILFPESDVLKAIDQRDFCSNVVEYDEFYEVQVGRVDPQNYIEQILLYYFTKDFKLISITMGDQYQNLQNKLYDEGKVKEKWSPAYQKKLMDGVRYWNGKEWQKEWVMLNKSN